MLDLKASTTINKFQVAELKTLICLCFCWVSHLLLIIHAVKNTSKQKLNIHVCQVGRDIAQLHLLSVDYLLKSRGYLSQMQRKQKISKVIIVS